MDSKRLWDKFMTTGKVEDYLAFRRAMEAASDNPVFEDLSSGNENGNKAGDTP